MPFSPGAAYIILKHARERRQATMTPEERAEDNRRSAEIWEKQREKQERIDRILFPILFGVVLAVVGLLLWLLAH